MKATVLLLRSQDIISDSRVLKYENFFKSKRIPYAIIGWDRAGRNLHRENTFYYRKIAGFQQGTKGIINRIWWNFYLFRFLLRHLTEYKMIHACDFDTVMPALVMKIFGKKVIFDIFDWFSDEVRTGKLLIDKPINVMEKFAVKHSNLVVICEEGRLQQMACAPKKYIVIPNLPMQLVDTESEMHATKGYSEVISIVYVGGLVHSRGIIELVNCVAGNPKFDLEIAGFGNYEIEEKIREKECTCENIHFYGKVSYEKAIKIMTNADLLYAMYYKDNANHIYAAPNKFYESVFLKKPIITTKGTLVGEKVKKYHTGFVIEEGEKNLLSFLNSINKERIEELVKHMPPRDIFLKRIEKNLAFYQNWLNS